MFGVKKRLGAFRRTSHVVAFLADARNVLRNLPIQTARYDRVATRTRRNQEQCVRRTTDTRGGATVDRRLQQVMGQSVRTHRIAARKSARNEYVERVGALSRSLQEHLDRILERTRDRLFVDSDLLFVERDSLTSRTGRARRGGRARLCGTDGYGG